MLPQRKTGTRPTRLASLIDSNVSRCAISKGRSRSRALTKVLSRISSVSLPCGLYGALPFCPTRLMPADGPSRGASVLPSLRSLAALLRLRRWASNWARLCLHLVPWTFPSPLDRDSRRPALTYVPPPFDFDSSLGLPGEGPFLRVFGVWFLAFRAAMARCSHVVLVTLPVRGTGWIGPYLKGVPLRPSPRGIVTSCGNLLYPGRSSRVYLPSCLRKRPYTSTVSTLFWRGMAGHCTSLDGPTAIIRRLLVLWDHVFLGFAGCYNLPGTSLFNGSAWNHTFTIKLCCGRY